jgi:XTP/dITP diphosphohydrolase
LQQLILASGNAHKAEELSNLLDPETIRVSAAEEKIEVTEDGETYEENALKKAEAYYKKYKVPVISDDSGLNVDFLPDELGIFSARFGGEGLTDKERCELLLKKLEGVSKDKRKAYFSCILCVYLSPQEIFFFEGRVNGVISEDYRGNAGFGYDYVFVPEKFEGNQTLEEGQEFKVIICQSHLDGERTAKGLFNYLVFKELEIPIIMIGDDPELRDHPEIITIKQRYEIPTLLKSCAKIIGITAKDMAMKKVPDFYPIPLRTLTYLETSNCDIFIKDVQAENETFNKILSEGDEITELKKLRKKGISTVYIPSKFRLQLTDVASQVLNKVLSDTKLTTEERVVALNEAYDFIGDNLQNIESAEEIVEMSKRCVENMTIMVEDNPVLNKLLDHLCKNPTSYPYKHSQLNAFLCSYVIKQMEWGSAEQAEKLAFVSFFHDILMPKEEMVKIDSNKELEESELSDKEKDIVKKHASTTANMVQNFPKAPIGADTIIKQHHGMLSGVGFESKSFSSTLSPLAIVFIVCEDFCKRLLAVEEIIDGKPDYSNFNQETVIKEMYLKFPSINYKRVVTVLEEIQMAG